jgi:hypothetical protein
MNINYPAFWPGELIFWKKKRWRKLTVTNINMNTSRKWLKLL